MTDPDRSTRLRDDESFREKLSRVEQMAADNTVQSAIKYTPAQDALPLVAPATQDNKFTCGYCVKCKEWKSQPIGQRCRVCNTALIQFDGAPATQDETQPEIGSIEHHLRRLEFLAKIRDTKDIIERVQMLRAALHAAAVPASPQEPVCKHCGSAKFQHKDLYICDGDKTMFEAAPRPQEPDNSKTGE